MTDQDGGTSKDQPPGESADTEVDSVAAGNPFVLGGLPTYAGLAPPKPERPRQRHLEQGDEYAGEWSQWLDDPDRTGEWDYDVDPDGDDSDTETLRDRFGRRVVRPVPQQEPAATGIGGGRVWATTVWSLAAVVTVGVIGGVVAVNVRASHEEQPPTAAAPPAAASSTTVPTGTSTLPASWDHATAGCTRTRSGSITVGADPGDRSTAQLAILGFEWSYYVDRDATLVRSFVTPDAKVSAVEQIQAGIDSQPEGVRYCVYITAGDSTGTVWDVELHEQWPGDPEPMRYGQRITTTTQGGKTLITGVARR